LPAWSVSSTVTLVSCPGRFDAIERLSHHDPVRPVDLQILAVLDERR
jgi:hypothetical protein